MPSRTAITAILAAACVFACGCRERAPKDDVPAPRIVSYSPAISGMVFAMGLGRHVVGVTTFCQVPEEFAGIAVVGDRARISSEAILAVRPDLLLVQQNPGDFDAVTDIAPNVEVKHFTIETLNDIASAIERIGAVAGEEQLGAVHKAEFLEKLAQVRHRVNGLARPRALFLMGFDRPSNGGEGTFLSEMIVAAGGANAAAEDGYSGWRMLNRENIQAMKPEVLICQISPGREDEAMEYWNTMDDLPAVRDGRVFLVTDSRWTVPSIWSAEFAEKLSEMIHPSAPEVRNAGG